MPFFDLLKGALLHNSQGKLSQNPKYLVQAHQCHSSTSHEDETDFFNTSEQLPLKNMSRTFSTFFTIFLRG
jgi:hypothetical protein